MLFRSEEVAHPEVASRVHEAEAEFAAAMQDDLNTAGALGAIFEADFGMRTAERVLERRLAEEGATDRAASHARALVAAVTLHRATIDAEIERRAPQYPVVQLARIDRALLRCAMGELVHCAATPTRVAIAEWVELARRYSGEPARRLMNGILGRVARDAPAARAGGRPVDVPEPDPGPVKLTIAQEEGPT